MSQILVSIIQKQERMKSFNTLKINDIKKSMKSCD